MSELESQVYQALQQAQVARPAPLDQVDLALVRRAAEAIQHEAQSLLKSGLEQHEAYDQATREVLGSLTNPT